MHTNLQYQSKEHQVRKFIRKGDFFMRLQLAIVPTTHLEEIHSAWERFTEYRTAKLIFTVLGALFTLLFGAFTVLSWGIIVTTSLHLIVRVAAYKTRHIDTYLSRYRHLGRFCITYFWLILGNTLNSFITINGLPEDTFLALFQCWLIWTEVCGIVDHAKIAGWPVPPILENLLYNKHHKLPF